jgi:TetR/AcrR family transcriptional regulator
VNLDSCCDAALNRFLLAHRGSPAAMPKAPAQAVARRRKSAPRAKAASTTKGPTLRDEFRAMARASILSAAEQVLAADGLDEARIEEIAKRARVAVGTIYNLVGDREALVGEIVGARQRELLNLLSQALETSQPFHEQLTSFVSVLFGYCREHGQFFRLVIEADRKNAWVRVAAGRPKATALDEIRALYRELIARGVSAGALEARDSEVYPAVLMGMLRETVFSDLETPAGGSPTERAAQIVRVFLEGAGKR